LLKIVVVVVVKGRGNLRIIHTLYYCEVEGGEKKRKMKFSENVDEIVALIMAVAGVAILLAGSYTLFILDNKIIVEELLLISSALLGPSTGYLFGKSQPKK
jgi:hypothetical protein